MYFFYGSGGIIKKKEKGEKEKEGKREEKEEKRGKGKERERKRGREQRSTPTNSYFVIALCWGCTRWNCCW
jgi:hypothetical protein